VQIFHDKDLTLSSPVPARMNRNREMGSWWYEPRTISGVVAAVWSSTNANKIPKTTRFFKEVYLQVIVKIRAGKVVSSAPFLYKFAPKDIKNALKDIKNAPKGIKNAPFLYHFAPFLYHFTAKWIKK